MRQIFRSPRLENVEQMATLLRDAGIAVRVTGDEGWKRATKRDFSYTDRRSDYVWPGLWVVEAEDFPKARQVLREHGLLDLTKSESSSFLPAASEEPQSIGTAFVPPERTASRWRNRLLALVGAVLVLIGMKLAGLY